MKRMKLILMCSKEIGFECLKALISLDRNSIVGVLTVPDQADTRSHHYLINELCYQTKIPIHTVSNKKDAEILIHSYNPDICLVIGWYWLISKEVLNTVPKIIGIHNSFLPKYRGASPLVWQIINGGCIINDVSYVGCSFFTIAPGMDTGDIWVQYKIRLDFDDYISDVIRKMNKKTVSVLKKMWLEILSDKYTPKPQVGIPSYCAQRIPEDGKVDWQKSAVQIYNFVRAQSHPYPGAFTLFKGKKIYLWRVWLGEEEYYGTPGQVAQMTSGGVHVICGDNKSIILETDVLNSIKTRL